MWSFDKDNNIWINDEDLLDVDVYEHYKQSYDSVLYYSKCLSGAIYYYVNDIEDIYDSLSFDINKWWYISLTYSVTSVPQQFACAIDSSTVDEYYNKYLEEYGFTLKAHFTPKRLINESLNNLKYVDVATTDFINLNVTYKNNLYIDGVFIKNGHRILVKDQKTYVTLQNTVDPETYFYPKNYYIVENPNNVANETTYYYYNEYNGIYRYENGKLIKEDDLNEYKKCINYSVYVKMGNINKDKQFHLMRLKNGYFPTDGEESIEFKEKKNWIIRNRYEYNNIYDINYYNVLKHNAFNYYNNVKNFTYSVPDRIVGVGAYGMIINWQNGYPHIIWNKYKNDLYDIILVDGYYWICGENGVLLKVSVVDFDIQKIDLGVYKNLKSISFLDEFNGVVVGEDNSIFITKDGGVNWINIAPVNFNGYNYNKVIYYKMNHIFIFGDTGVFLELKNTLNGWIINKKKISKYIEDDEYILFNDINDAIVYKGNGWNVVTEDINQQQQPLQQYKEFILFVTSGGDFIIYDINGFFNNKFIYLQFDEKYNDIKNIVYKNNNSTTFIFSNNNGLYTFDLNMFQVIKPHESNIIKIYNNATPNNINNNYYNKIVDYNGVELLFAGNNSLLGYITYNPYSINDLINNNYFYNKYKSKLLFLDYDIASKLYFFDENNNYRLPNSVEFNANYLINGVFNIDAISGEKNWITYYKDIKKTFRYYTNITDMNAVLFSTTFSYTTNNNEFNINTNNISINLDDIINLAPNINQDGHSRYIQGSGPAITSPTSVYDLYLYDYLMILRTPQSSKADVGDVIKMESPVVNGYFVVNRVIDFGGYSYNYIYTDFNQTILNMIITSTQNIKLTNINKYKNIQEFVNNFNEHYISNAYLAEYDTDNNIVKINPIYTPKSAYYNLAANVNIIVNNNTYTYNIEYNQSFIDFGYKPNYNIKTYLENINPVFSNKEFLSLPHYYNIPCDSGANGLNDDNIYIDSNVGFYYGPNVYWLNPSQPPLNKLIFGKNLKNQWESLLMYTFVDLIIYYLNDPKPVETNKLLIIKKYKTIIDNKEAYVIEFHKAINYNLGNINAQYISILSRRHINQISDDLEELNNIQKPKSLFKQISMNISFSNYESELNFKFPTDSYAKVLLSDYDIRTNLTGIVYIDYKNELSINMLNVDKEYYIPIVSTTNYIDNNNNYLYVMCSEKHGLSNGDGVILEFTGGVGSSQELNPHYFGFHTVGVIPGNEYDFFVYTNYGQPTNVNGDPGYVKIIKRDPFLYNMPVDLIDLGVDKKIKNTIEIKPDNIIIKGRVHGLVNVNYKNYRYKLYDGLTLDLISDLYPWILEADVSKVILGMDDKYNLIWYSGIWHCGKWFGYNKKENKNAVWISGVWYNGDWYGGIWNSNSIYDEKISASIKYNDNNTTNSIWHNGRWYGGIWNNGTWLNGRWYDGVWNNGVWLNGVWNNGVWNDGRFSGGIWVNGIWNDGKFNTDNKPSYWINGKWFGGEFENGIWYDGVFKQNENKTSRFGTRSVLNKISIWHNGEWFGGDFYSGMTKDSNGNFVSTNDNRLSVWMTGKWYGGKWHGGIAYNIDFNNSMWINGILDEIEIVGINTMDEYFIIKGDFRFKPGQRILVVGEDVFPMFGTYDNPIEYLIIKCEQHPSDNNKRLLHVDMTSVINNISNVINIDDYNTKLKIISKFIKSRWYGGICYNGYFEDSFWYGGLFYDGIFNGQWQC